MGTILIALDTDPAIPSPYWKEGGTPKRDRQGDLTQGSVCLTPDAERKTECSVWRPFGEGARLTIRTNNQDPIFVDMPVDEAREMIRRARDITLAIITQ